MALTRRMFGISLALLTITLSGCALGSSDAKESTSTNLPAPIAPAWLTDADLARLTKTFETDTDKLDAFFQDLDFFVATAIANPGRTRNDRIAGSVLMVKCHLHGLFYPVAFDSVRHPANDPDFYRALATFERRAGLAVDGKFTVAEATRLTFLAGVAVEPEVRTSLKQVFGDAAYASAEGTWVLQGETIAAPVNRGKISCWKYERMCRVFTADVLVPAGRKPLRS